MEGVPKWWIISKNKIQKNAAVIFNITNTVKKEVRPKRAPTTMFLHYNRRLLPLVGAG